VHTYHCFVPASRRFFPTFRSFLNLSWAPRQSSTISLVISHSIFIHFDPPPPISLTFFSFYSYNDQIGSDEPFPGVKVHCLVPTVGNDQQSLGDLFAGIFGKGRGKVVPVEEADVYILVWNCIRVIVGCKNARSLRVENGKCTPRNEKKTFLHKLCQNCSDLVLRFLQLPTLVFLTSCCACAIKSFKDHIHLPRAAPIGRSTHAGPGQNPHFPQPQGEITRSIVAHSWAHFCVVRSFLKQWSLRRDYNFNAFDNCTLCCYFHFISPFFHALFPHLCYHRLSTTARHLERRFGLTCVPTQRSAVPVPEPYSASVLSSGALLCEKREPPALPRQLPGKIQLSGKSQALMMMANS